MERAVEIRLFYLLGGLASAQENITDFDFNINRLFDWVTGNNVSNAPTSGDISGFLLTRTSVLSGGTTEFIQVFFSMNGSIYYRYRHNYTWSAWKTVTLT